MPQLQRLRVAAIRRQTVAAAALPAMVCREAQSSLNQSKASDCSDPCVCCHNHLKRSRSSRDSISTDYECLMDFFPQFQFLDLQVQMIYCWSKVVRYLWTGFYTWINFSFGWFVNMRDTHSGLIGGYLTTYFTFHSKAIVRSTSGKLHLLSKCPVRCLIHWQQV